MTVRSLALFISMVLVAPVLAAPSVAMAAAKKPAARTKPTREVEAEKAMYAGGIAYEDGDYEEALSHFERARELSPAASGPYKALGYTYLKVDRLAAARAAFEMFLATTKTGAGTDEARNAITAIDARLRKIEEEKRAASESPRPALPVGADDGAERRGVRPLQVAGFTWAGLGLVSVGIGSVFVIQLFQARSAFGDEYDAVRSSLVVEDGVPGETLHVCNEDDFARFSVASRDLLGPAREHCSSIRTRHVIVPILLGAGVALIGSGLVVGLVAGGKKRPYDEYALGVGPLRLGVSLTPGGATLIADGIF